MTHPIAIPSFNRCSTAEPNFSVTSRPFSPRTLVNRNLDKLIRLHFHYTIFVLKKVLKVLKNGKIFCLIFLSFFQL